MTNGEILINQIMAEGDDGRRSTELLSQFFGGFPLENLVPLLRSHDEATVKVGTYIAEELGAQARPLIPELTPLLGHSSKAVRYDVITAILNAATVEHGEAIARAIMLVNDPEQAVRKNALDFLARADREQLTAALLCLGDDEIAAELRWLLEIEEPPRSKENDTQIESRLDSTDRLKRRFAGIAAARMYRRNPDLLDRLVANTDEELCKFAQSQLKRFRLEPRRFREQQ